MRSILKNNIFTNPQGWAQNIVGSSYRYRLMQSFTVVQGAMVFVFVVATCKLAEIKHLCPHHYVGVGFMLSFGGVMMPLFYLKALRYYVSDSTLRSKLSN